MKPRLCPECGALRCQVQSNVVCDDADDCDLEQATRCLAETNRRVKERIENRDETEHREERDAC